MNSSIFMILLISLILTLIFELLFAIIVGIKNKKDLILICLVNILTNPFVVLTYCIFLYFTNVNLILVTCLLELLAIAVEGIIYKFYGTKIKHPILFSILANVFSYVLGMIINYLL